MYFYFMKTLFKIIAGIALILFVAFFFIQKKSIPYDTLKEKYKMPSSKFIEIDGMNVHYSIEGEGTPILLIHGTGSVLQTWNAWSAALLKNNFKVIRLDLPAFGLTGPRSDNDYSAKTYVAFLDRFMQKIGIDSFAIAGNSLGGELAWKYAYKFPQKVSKLILVDPAGFYSAEKGNGAIVFKLAKVKWLAQLMSKMDTRILVNRTLEDVYFDDSKISDATREMYYDMSLREGNRESFTARVQQIGNEPSLDVSKIQAPTLTMWGKQDELLDISLLSHFTKIPHHKEIVYDNCGHSPQEEIPEISVKDAIDFLK